MESSLVEDPVLRQRYRFARDGALLRVEVWAEPGSAVPDHFHPGLEERWGVAHLRVEVDPVLKMQEFLEEAAAPPAVQRVLFPALAGLERRRRAR